MKRALITGINGQDGSYLAGILIEKGYDVYGLIRDPIPLGSEAFSNKIFNNSEILNQKTNLYCVNLLNPVNLTEILCDIKPDEIYNLAAQSHVGDSFNSPELTANVSGLGTLRILESIRKSGLISKTRFHQASSSEMYGVPNECPQTEMTPFHPRSPYACSKVFAHYTNLNYRESYKLHASSSILFNHESPRRGETFVTRKITLAAARIKMGLQKKLSLGNLDAKRDWGYAPEYVEAMWLIVQQDNPNDYVIATGKLHSIKEFCQEAFGFLDLDWKEYVEYDTSFQRPNDNGLIKGDYTKAKKDLGWEPKTSFKELIKIMVKSDLELAQKEKDEFNKTK